MKLKERMKKYLSILLCLCMLVQNCPVVAFAAADDNLCEHHTEHTAECHYAEAVEGQPCTHEHSEDCYAIPACLHTCGDECEDPCTHECTVENGCITMELDCRHVHGDCGYSEGTAEVPCGHVHNENCGYAEAVAGNPCANAETDPECDHSGDCGYVAAVEGAPCGHSEHTDCGYAPATEGAPCTHVCEVMVNSADSCYKLLCSHKDGGHDDACGYVESVSGFECTYHCHICHVQELVDALPGEVTAENTEAVAVQLTAIDNEKAALSDEELTQVDFTKYIAAAEGLDSVYAAVPAIDPTCTCESKCAEGSVNSECAVCSVEGADLTACLGAEAEGQEISYIQRSWDGSAVVSTTGVVTEYQEVTAHTTKLFEDCWYVVTGDVTVSETIINVVGETNLILCDGASLTASQGIHVEKGGYLNVYGQTAGTGKLTAYGKDNNAAIGRSRTGEVGFVRIYGGDIEATGQYGAGIDSNINIYGGTVTATGGENGAGIASGYTSGIDGISIFGGTVTATGGKNGAGIGQGSSGKVGIINIYGGTVTATGGENGAGIGQGSSGEGGTINIFGGTVTANGGDFGAGIGTGSGGSSETAMAITISGGTVTANGGYNGTGIGMGSVKQGGTITITGGMINATGKGYFPGIGRGASESSTNNTETTVSISGGTVIGRSMGESCGIGCGKQGTQSGGTVTLSGNAHIWSSSGSSPTSAFEYNTEGTYYSRDTEEAVFTKDGTTSVTRFYEWIGEGHLCYVQNSDGRTHNLGCPTDCPKAAALGDSQDCSGGEATCANGAYCSVCDSKYGAVDTTNHDSSVAFDSNGFCPNGCYEPAVQNGDVYEISNAGQLYWFAAKVNAGETAINGKLMDNITVNPGTFNTDGVYTPKNGETARTWTPIGNDSNAYTGTFDGNGKTISGLFIFDQSAHFIGLFGHVSSGTVKHVGVTGSFFECYSYVGSVVGFNTGTVEDCYSSNNTVKGAEDVGGVVGYNNGTVTKCYNTHSVKGSVDVGGVVGTNYGTVKHCYNTGNVSGDTNVGGVVGQNVASIEYCYNTGTVSCALSNGGGVVGYSSGSEYVCFYLDTCGQNGEGFTKTAEQFACGELVEALNVGSAETVWKQTIGTDATPNFTGQQVFYGYTSCADTEKKYTNDANASETKPEHSTTADGDKPATCTQPAYCSVCESYYGEVDTTNHDSSVAFDDEGFCPNGCYQPAELKDGYYQIKNAGNLYWFAQQVNSGNGAINGKLTANIVVNQNVLVDGALNSNTEGFRVWTPIGTEDNRYEGIFDGNGKTISGLYFNDSTANYVGLFGGVTNGQVKAVTLTDSSITGCDYVGGIVGYNYGTVTGCVNNAVISGDSGVGGIVGHNGLDNTVELCGNTGKITGSTETGGIAGRNTGTTRNCYNTGDVHANDKYGTAGGIAGFNNGTAEYCWSAGKVTAGGSYKGGITGHNYKTIQYCYATQNSIGEAIYGSTSNNVGTRTAAQFASGQVAYRLSQGENGGIWGQTIGENGDAYPVLGGEKVYYGYISCGDDAVMVYTNVSTASETKPEHTGNLSYKVNEDGTHTSTYSCCGTEATESHAMNTATGECVCGLQMAEASVTKNVAGGIMGIGPTTYYKTLNEAIGAVSTATAEDNAVVTLLKTIDLGNNHQLISSGVFTLDLNGNTLTSSSRTLEICGADTNVTITDSQTGGTVSGKYYGVYAKKNSTVTISGGTVSGEYDGVNANNSTVTISGGTVSGEYDGVYADNSTVTISGGTVSGNTVSGESYGVYAYHNCTVTISGGTVSGEYDGVYAYDNSTVTISSGEVSGESYGVYADSSTVTINGGAVSGESYGVYAKKNSTVTINGGTVKGSGTSGTGVCAYSNSTVTISGGTVSGGYYGVYAEQNSTVTISNGEVSGESDGMYADSSTVTISGGEVSGESYGVYAVESTVTISGGSISGKICSAIVPVKLTLAEGKTVGARFPGGITVTNYTLQEILGEGAAYWQGGKMIVPTADQLEITGGDVTVKKACDHSANTSKPADNGDGTHSYTCTVCGVTIVEEHSFENDAHKCVCGKVETFTVYWASAESLGLETGTSTFGQDFVQTITVPENTHLRIDDVYLRSDSSVPVKYTYENGVLTIAAEDLPAGDIEVLCDHYVEVKFDANGGVIRPDDGYPAEGDNGFAENASYWVQECIAGGELNPTLNAVLLRTGYTFVGWRDATGKVYPMGSWEGTFVIATEDVTLYAQWQCNHTIGGVEYRDNGDGTHNGYCGECDELLGNYVERPHVYDETTHQCICGVIETFTYRVETYTMNAYGNYVAPETQRKSAAYGTTVNAAPTSVAEGFYLDTQNENSLLTATVPANDALALRVYIGREQYSITWDLNGGTYDNNLPESMYYGISQLTIFGGFVKEGHAFSHLEDQFGNQYRDATPDSDSRRFRDVDMPVGGLTLKAIWTVNAYALHVQDQTLNVDYGTALDAALSGITPGKTGHTFTGWSYYYLDEEEVKQPYTGTTMPAVELYAEPVFTPIEYKITWDMAGCTYELRSLNELPAVLEYNSDSTEYELDFAWIEAPVGYELVGFVDGNGNTLSMNDNTGSAFYTHRLYIKVSGDMTIKAVIEPATYSATWETGDGGSYEKEFKYGETITIPDSEIFRETFRKAGYTLVGWTGYTEGMTMPIGGVTFKAKWQINPASLDVTSGTYDGTAHKPTVTVEGLTEGEDFTVTYPADMTSAGEKVITVTGKLGGETTVTYTVEKAPAPDITFPTVLNDITYGQELQEAKLSFYENELGTFNWAAPGGSPNAGEGDYALDFYPGDLENYDWASANWQSHGANWNTSRNALCAFAQVLVHKAEAEYETPGFDPLNAPTYNGTLQALATPGSTGHGTMVYSLSENGPYTEEVPMVKDAGMYRVWFKVIGDENHTDAQPQYIDTQIQKASLRVTANDNAITYGDTPSDNGVTYEGFVGGDTAAVLNGELTYSHNYAQFGNVGTYKITPSGVTSDNYEITFMDGILTVNPKGITEADVELTDTLTYTGRQQTQAVAVADGVTYEVTGNQATNAGTYRLTVTGTGNYSGSVTKTWSIAKAEQTIQVIEPQEMVCGESHDLSVSAKTRLTYVSSDPAVVSVDENGTLTALKAGTVTITITAQETDNYLSAQKTITVTVGHSYEAEITKPTCEDKGYTAYTCVCGHSYVTDYVNATGHDYDDGVITTKPGCETEGIKTFTCANDKSHTYTEKISATGHEHTAVVTAPTCVDKGYTTYTCVCDNSYVADYVSATGHSLGGWTIVKNPTCTEKGSQRRDCEKCDHFESRDTAALGHEYQDPMDSTCQICDERRDVYVESIPMFRLYNPNTGEHHYTGSAVERDMLVEAGWNYEGVAWNAPVEYGEPVCRYYNPNTGDHHYTMCATEGEDLIEAGWIYEGVAWNSASADHLPIYRLYNPNATTGTHHYTGSAEERDMLVEEGWRYEGIAWYALLH